MNNDRDNDREYYQKELHALRKLAAEFSAANPALAPRLAGTSPDPDVERILEGLAFLTGRVRREIDSNFPRIAESLLNRFCPHYLRPLPSATIVAFSPGEMLTETVEVPAGTYLDTEASSGRCRFRTVYPVRVSPLSCTSASVARLETGDYAVELHLQLNGMDFRAWNESHIRFYIGGDFPGASDVYMLLNCYLKRVEIQAEGASPHVLTPDCLRPAGLTPEETMLLYPPEVFPAFAWIQEYLLLKEKFLFVDLYGFSEWRERPRGLMSLRVRFILNEPPAELPLIDRQRFVLHATPAVNLYTREAEPVHYDQTTSEVRVSPVGGEGAGISVYSVDRVAGYQRERGVSGELVSSMDVTARTSEFPAYEVSYRESDEGTRQAYIGLIYGANSARGLPWLLTAELTCSDGAKAAQLRPGDLKIPTPAVPETVSFVNLLPPCEALPAPSGDEVLWSMISHLSLNYSSVLDAHALRSLLENYLFGVIGGEARAANKQRVNGIEALDHGETLKISPAGILRGKSVKLKLATEAFTGLGDMYLFATIIARLLAAYASVNSFVEVESSETRYGVHFKWPPMMGTQIIV